MKAKLRNWGSSLGIIVPANLAKDQNLKAGDEVEIELKKQNPLREAFGSMPNLNIDSQKMKDELRKEWARDFS